MNEREIRNYFARNWVFWLLRRLEKWKLPPIVAVLGIPLVIFVIGAGIAALTGNLYLFRCNLLAYPVGLTVALAAYAWFAVYFPKYLAQIYAAFDAPPEVYSGKIKKWADRIANRFWVIGLASLVVALLNVINFGELWQRNIWLGDVWAASPAPLFFKIYYAFIDILAGGFVLGSGAVGILGVMFLIYDLLRLRLKLSHTRILRAIGSLSVGLSIWALLAFAFVGPIRSVSAPNILCVAAPVVKIDAALVLSNLGVSILASIAVICSLLLPVYFAHRAIVREKDLQIDHLLAIQSELFIKANQLADDLAARYKNGLNKPSVPQDRSFVPQGRPRWLLSKKEEPKSEEKEFQDQTQALNQELQTTYDNIAAIKKMIEEVESVADWPITVTGVRELVSVAVIPPLTNLVLGLLPAQTAGQKTFIQILGDFIKGLFK